MYIILAIFVYSRVNFLAHTVNLGANSSIKVGSFFLPIQGEFMV